MVTYFIHSSDNECPIEWWTEEWIYFSLLPSSNNASERTLDVDTVSERWRDGASICVCVCVWYGTILLLLLLLYLEVVRWQRGAVVIQLSDRTQLSRHRHRVKQCETVKHQCLSFFLTECNNQIKIRRRDFDLNTGLNTCFTRHHLLLLID